jgi:hypothetical protein
MSQAIPTPSNCCSPCSETVNVSVPGPTGPAGTNGTNGVDGENSYTSVVGGYAQPAVNATVSVSVVNSDWIVPGMIVFIQFGGYYEVMSVTDSVTIVVKNLGYDANSPVATAVPNASRVSASGEKGVPGSGSGDMLKVDNLFGLTNASTALDNLTLTGVGKNIARMTNPNLVGVVRINADNTVTFRTIPNFINSDLSLQVGVDVQAYDTQLAALANNAVPAAAATIPIFVDASSSTVTSLTAFAQTIIDDTSAAMMLTTLGLPTEKVLPRYGLLGSRMNVDLNAGGTDSTIAMDSARYRIDKIILDNATANITTATAGVFTAGGGGGTTVVTSAALAALTATTKFMDMTLAGGVTSDVLTDATLYFRVGTPQGGAALVNVWIFGYSLVP